MAENTAARVEKLVAPTITNMGYDLWDVRFIKEGTSWYLRIFIDKDGGVDINDCTDVSHAVDPILDEADPIDKAYYLEVCSPGLLRELSRPEHFTKMQGREIAVHLYRPVNDKRDYNGTLMSFDGGIKLLTDGEEIYFEKGTFSSVKLNDIEL